MRQFIALTLLIGALIGLSVSSVIALARQQTPPASQLFQGDDGYLYRTDYDNMRPLRLKNLGNFPIAAAFFVSPNDKRLVLTVANPITNQYIVFFVIDLENETSYKLTSLEYITFCAWTPDSQWVIFQSLSLAESNHIYKINIDGDLIQQIADGYIFFEALSPDGQEIFVADSTLGGISRVSLSGNLHKQPLTTQEEQTYHIYAAIHKRFAGQTTLLPPIKLPYRAWLLPLISLLMMAISFISQQRRNILSLCVIL